MASAFGGGDPHGDNAMSLAHDYVTKPLVWSTTHERAYKAPADLRPYSQHLLRFKTTSSLTAPSVHGSIASGVHVVKVGSRSVAAGTAPAEGFYPVRRPTGSREFLEVQYDSGAATPQLPRTAKVTGLSQVQPPQVTLLRHLTSFDHGPTTSDEQTVRQQFAGLPPTTDSNLGMRTQRAAMVSKFAKLTSAVTHSGHTSEFRQTFMDPCADSAEVEATMDVLLEQRHRAAAVAHPQRQGLCLLLLLPLAPRPLRRRAQSQPPLLLGLRQQLAIGHRPRLGATILCQGGRLLLLRAARRRRRRLPGRGAV